MKIGDTVKISKYKNVFATKGYTLNWSEEVLVIKKVKNTVPWTCIISDLKRGEIFGTFYEKELPITNQQEFVIEKVTKGKSDAIKKKGDKIHVKWKG